MYHLASLRQRKKARTRRALADAATQLFAERGFDQVSIADVADAAEVSPRTFYSYFTSKDDVLLTDLDDRLAVLAAVPVRLPDEALDDALRRIGAAIVSTVSAQAADEQAGTRARIIRSRPALLGAAFVRLWTAEQQMAQALHAAFPDQLDEIDSAAMVGALMGALRGASQVASPGERPARGRSQLIVDRVLQLLAYGVRCHPRSASRAAPSRTR